MTTPTTERRVPERTPRPEEEWLESEALAFEALLAEVPDTKPSDADRRRVPRTTKAHLFVTLCHWGMVIFLALSLLSGLRIGWGFVESPFFGPHGRWGNIIHSLSPKGTLIGVNLMTLHVVLAFCMLLVVGVYVGYLIRSKSTARLRVTGQDLSKLWRGIRTREFWRNKAALWSANVLVYWLFFLFFAVMVVTGISLYRLDWGLAETLGGYSQMRMLHAVFAYVLLPVVVLHGVLQWFFGRFWTIFKARLFAPHIRAGAVSLAVIVPVIIGIYLWDGVLPTLTVKRVAEGHGPHLDGNANDPVWNDAEAVVVRTVKGVNNPHDHVDVAVKAVHDGKQIYFLFQWDDPDASLKRFPLVKTAHGWKVLQTAFEVSDESMYYEDKLAVYLTDVPRRSCAATCHLGVGPHAANGEKHGVHYTSGEVGDVWHWKAVRTSPMGAVNGEAGFIDDQHFRAPDPLPTKPGGRYMAGYYADPHTGGGYDYNFVKLDPKKPLAETYVRPRLLPASPPRTLSADPTESAHDDTWWIHKSQGVPYTPAADTYPVGTLIPNIVIAPFQGDRADVRAQAQWRMGRWTLETRRVLDTKSTFDVPFSFEKPVYLSVAPFNRTQTRHGEHLRPVKVVLQP